MEMKRLTLAKLSTLAIAMLVPQLLAPGGAHSATKPRRKATVIPTTSAATAVPAATTISPTTGGTPTTSNGSVNSSPPLPSRTAIKVMLIASIDGFPAFRPFTPLVSGFVVRSQAANSAGGFGGRKIEYSVCNERYDPKIAVECAQRAIAENVDAVVATWELFPASILPILEPAGIPIVGVAVGPATQDLLMGSKVAFATTSSNYGGIAGLLGQLGADGCTRLGFIGEARNAALAKRFAIRNKMDVVAESLLSPVDLSGAATVFAAKGVECVAAILPTYPALRTFVEASERLGKTYRYGITSIGIGRASQMTETGFAQLGPSIDFMLVATGWALNMDKANPEIVKMQAEFAMFDPAFEGDDLAVWGWADAAVLFNALGTVKGDINRSTIIDALNRYENQANTVYGPFSMAKNTGFPGLGRLYNANTWIRRVVNGRLQSVTRPVDVAADLRG
jgi:ABC-type branched-subunit amino acid transport system substrate-binding protein